MIKISLKALTNVLLGKGHTYTIERSKNHQDKLVYKFVVGLKYPNFGPVVHYDKEDVELSMKEVRETKDGKVIVLYDSTKDVLLGMSCEVLDLIKTAKKEAIQKLYNNQAKQSTTVQLVVVQDEFGREFHADV